MIGLVHAASDVFRRRSPHNGLPGLVEDIALRYLRRHGCIVVERNYRAPSGVGGIDLVACQGAAMVFVEVRTCTAGEQGAPDCVVDSVKRSALEGAAREYVYRNHVEWLHRRFDVLSIVVSHPVRVDWKRDVFG